MAARVRASARGVLALSAVAAVAITAIVLPAPSSADSSTTEQSIDVPTVTTVTQDQVTTVTKDQVTTSPAWQRLGAAAAELLEKDFTLTYVEGSDPAAEAPDEVIADVMRRGPTYRFVQPYQVDPYGVLDYTGQVIVYATPRTWCLRKATRAYPASITADLKARWTCKRGSQGWMEARSRAAAAVTKARDDFAADVFSPYAADFRLYGSDLAVLADPQTTSLAFVQQMPYTDDLLESISCTPGTEADTCTFSFWNGRESRDLSIRSGAARLPLLTSTGRLVRR